MQEQVALGIDIGGTNTVFGLVRKNGQVIVEGTFKTKLFPSPTDLATAILSEIESVPEFSQLVGIGIGAPNGNAFTGNIEFAPNLIWKGIVPIASVFENVFKKPTLVANDANAAAIGEHLFGCAQDLTDFVTITLGTGLGSGIFIDGKLVIGHQGLAGEFGHIRVVPNGRLCGCGRKGCLETYVSSKGVVRSLAELESVHKSTSSLMRMEVVNAYEIFKEAHEGDVFAQEIVEFTAQILGSSLADFAAFSNPQAYILFGGIAQSGTHFAERVHVHFEQNALKIYQNSVEIRVSQLHDKNAAVLGTAASLFWKAN